MAVLQMLKGDASHQRFELAGERAVIGRHPECDIVLELSAVSRQHAQVTRDGPDFFVEDLGSRNGTFLNGRKVGGRARLRPNDRVKIGDVLFTFHHDEPEGFELLAADDPTGSTIVSTIEASASSHLRFDVKPETKLRAILEISKNLSQTLSLGQRLPRILESLFKIFPQADNGYVILKDSTTGMVVPRAVKHRSENVQDRASPSRTIVTQAMKTCQAILSADAASDARFQASQSVADFRIRSMMCAPLVTQQGDALGVIQLDTQDPRNQFRQEDLDVLVSVAAASAVAVENAQFHDAAIEQDRLAQELAFARQVQQGFLPMEPPQVQGYRFFHYYDAAQEVGGDYFDYLRLPQQRLAVTLGDVAGKGVPAALLMARLSAAVRYALLSEQTASGALTLLDQELDRTVHQDHFATCVLAILDVAHHRVELANAGHPPPLLRRPDGRIEKMGGDRAGLPLGVAPELPYGQVEFALEPGDVLVIYSDGISEAKNSENKLYGMDRIARCLAEGPADVEQLGEALLADVSRFVGGRGQSDDISLVCFSRVS